MSFDFAVITDNWPALAKGFGTARMYLLKRR